MSPADSMDYRAYLYDTYVSTHFGAAEDLSSAVLRRDILRHIPPTNRPILDLGCGKGDLVAALISAGYTSVSGIDISSEQVDLAVALGLPVIRGDALDALNRASGTLAAVTATDFLEHLTKEEVLDLVAAVYRALTPGGILVARVPNAVSPFGGNYRHGDLTHESWYTVRAVRQLCAAAGFSTVNCFECSPVVHGVRSAVRFCIWRCFDLAFKLALLGETGSHHHIVTQNFVFVAQKDPGASCRAGTSGTSS